MVTVIVRKMYALILKSAWSLLRTLGDRKNAAIRGARPDLPAQISAGGFPVWSSALAAADGLQHEATAGQKRRREAERCFDPVSGSASAQAQAQNDIYRTPGTYNHNI